VGRETVEGVCDGLFEGLDRSLRRAAEQTLELGERLFDRIEVRAVQQHFSAAVRRQLEKGRRKFGARLVGDEGLEPPTSTL
jgi:hypothetical protein